MDIKRLAEEVKEKAEEVVEQRGGTDALKADLAEVKDIVTGEGSLADKARAAAKALEDPGKPGAGG